MRTQWIAFSLANLLAATGLILLTVFGNVWSTSLAIPVGGAIGITMGLGLLVGYFEWYDHS
jgi:hypothetical protein